MKNLDFVYDNLGDFGREKVRSAASVASRFSEASNVSECYSVGIRALGSMQSYATSNSTRSRCLTGGTSNTDHSQSDYVAPCICTVGPDASHPSNQTAASD